MTSTDTQIPLLPQTEKDEVEEGRTVDHLIDINGTNEDSLGSQTKYSANQIFDKEFKDLNNSSIKSCTIFIVNVVLRESHPDAYTPKMVSIGPYYRKSPRFRPMKKYKLLYLQRFLERREGLDVEICISELEILKAHALMCYEELEDLNTDEFCQMLLLDGCFVVEFIREYCRKCRGEEEIINVAGYMHHQVLRDLMLLENQLPFFILEMLHDLTKEDDESPFLLQANILVTFYVGFPTMIGGLCNAGDIKHLLHLVHITSSHGKNPKEKLSWITRPKALPNAIELSEAGVRFVTRSRSSTSLFDIEFENALMTIPPLDIFSYTESLLRNLIAYEQQSSDVLYRYFSDYVTFMNHLIDSDKDAALLQQNGIIQNWTEEDKEVVSFFNRLGNGSGLFSDFHYDEVCLKAIEHCEKPSSKFRAFMMHNYFDKPWARASTVAAIILFILTIIQTILTFLQVKYK